MLTDYVTKDELHLILLKKDLQMIQLISMVDALVNEVKKLKDIINLNIEYHQILDVK